MDAPGRYQKAAWIDFTTRCLAYVFGESWAPARRLAFGQQSLRMVRTKRNFRRAELRSLRSTREDLEYLRAMWLCVRYLRKADTTDADYFEGLATRS